MGLWHKLHNYYTEWQKYNLRIWFNYICHWPFSSIFSKAPRALLVLTLPNISFTLVAVLNNTEIFLKLRIYLVFEKRSEDRSGRNKLGRLRSSFKCIFLRFCLLYLTLQKLQNVMHSMQLCKLLICIVMNTLTK